MLGKSILHPLFFLFFKVVGTILCIMHKINLVLFFLLFFVIYVFNVHICWCRAFGPRNFEIKTGFVLVVYK